MESIEVGPFEFHDKIPLKSNYKEKGVRVVPHAISRYGSFIEKGAVLMPSYVNIGAYVDSGTMVDTWATVGSCAQIGKNVHLSGGVGIGGVLEPVQAAPVIIEDDAFIGSRCIIVEGVKIENELSKSILEKLGFNILSEDDIWDITPPSWRPDIDGIADIIEEIIRINGYDKIHSIKLPRNNYIAKPAMSIKHRQAFFASRILASRGYNEVITFSFLNKIMADQFNGGGFSLNLVNPISSELTDMRPSIIPNLLLAVQKNVNIGCLLYTSPSPRD